jgi:DNA replication protein DnaC
LNATTQVCPECNDTGWKSIGEGRERRVTRCDCQRQQHAQKLLERARIPQRYQHCDLGSYVPRNGSKESQAQALLVAQGFVREYPMEKTGLLMMGPIGVGKTHLAVGIIKELILKKNVPCLFYDYRELLKQIQNSYNPTVAATELEVLRPVFNAELLVLDELGAVKPTEWVWDTVSHILNTRYNDNRTTILTTNFENAPPRREGPEYTNAQRANKANSEETLGDRIGERMRSRLHEMCRILQIDGEDFRKTVHAVSWRTKQFPQ